MQYNRKQRKALEKKLGFTKKKFLADNPDMTEQDYYRRKAAAGKQIYLQNREAVLNEQMKQEAELEAKKAQQKLELEALKSS